MFFRKSNLICKIEKEIDTDETMEQFLDRGYFVMNQNPQTEEEYNTAVLYSRIYINVKYKKCMYEDRVMMILKNKMIEKIF